MEREAEFVFVVSVNFVMVHFCFLFVIFRVKKVRDKKYFAERTVGIPLEGENVFFYCRVSSV